MFYNSSSIAEIEYSRDDPLFWDRPTPINCNVVRITGIFLCLCGFVGIVLNGLLVYSFVRYKELRTPPNIFIMFIASIGLLASFTIVPLTGVSSIYCHWLFGRIGCKIEAIIAFLYGGTSSYLLCAVSLTRCYIIIRPFNAKDVTVGRCLILAIISVFLAFIWTMLPLMGWNEYTIEGARTSCCVNIYDRHLSFMLYNLVILIFIYLIPLIILMTTNTIIYLGLKRMKDKIAHGIKADLSQRKIEMERRILKSVLMTVCGFIVTWSPYAVVFCTTVLGGKNTRLPPAGSFICACFAKTSVMWIPMLYISTSTYFKFRFVDLNPFEKYGRIVQIAEQGFDSNNQTKNKEKPFITNLTSDNKDLSATD